MKKIHLWHNLKKRNKNPGANQKEKVKILWREMEKHYAVMKSWHCWILVFFNLYFWGKANFFDFHFSEFLLSAKTCTKAIPKSFWTRCCFKVQFWPVPCLQGGLWVPLGSHNWFFRHEVYWMLILSLLGNRRRIVKFRFAF